MTIDPLDNSVYAETRAKWRAWLRGHHRKKTEIWLVFYKKHTGKACPTYDEAVEEALCYGWVDSIKKRVDDERYVFKFTPRKLNSRWSATNKRRVESLIKNGKMTKFGLGLVEAARKSGAWDQKTVAETEFAFPTELKSALSSNRTAKKNFDSLSPSCRKQYIGWIASAKKPETRIRRAREAIKLLKENRKLGMK